MSEEDNNQFYRKKKGDKIKNIKVWLCVQEVSTYNFLWNIVYEKDKSVSAISGDVNCKNKDRAYLLAILEFLQWIKESPKHSIEFFVDNTYVFNLFTEWIDKWKKHDFKKSLCESSKEDQSFKKSLCESSKEEDQSFKKSLCESSKEDQKSEEEMEDRPNADIIREIENERGYNEMYFSYQFFINNNLSDAMKNITIVSM